MKKKLLSLLLAGMVFLSMGLSADCLAAPHHGDNGRSAQHRMFKPHSHGPQKVKKHKKTKHKKLKKEQQHKKFQFHRHKSNVKPKPKHKKNTKFFQRKHNKPAKKHHIKWRNPFRRR